jgi:hypothetical protein
VAVTHSRSTNADGQAALRLDPNLQHRSPGLAQETSGDSLQRDQPPRQAWNWKALARQNSRLEWGPQGLLTCRQPGSSFHRHATRHQPVADSNSHCCSWSLPACFRWERQDQRRRGYRLPTRFLFFPLLEDSRALSSRRCWSAESEVSFWHWRHSRPSIPRFLKLTHLHEYCREVPLHGRRECSICYTSAGRRATTPYDRLDSTSFRAFWKLSRAEGAEKSCMRIARLRFGA